MASETPNQFETDARTDKAMAMARVIMETARECQAPALEVFPTNDSEWFRVWRMAKCATAPSEQTKALCREFVGQLQQLEEIEQARREQPESDDASDRHVDRKIAEGRGM